MQNGQAMSKSKANYTNFYNKLLDGKIKAHYLKSKIAKLVHPSSQVPLENVQDIADAFWDYSQSLYDLSADPNLTQPSNSTIASFLYAIQLPSLSATRLWYP